MTTINDRLKLLRKAKGISQEAFGETLGLTGASISRFEAGSRDISDATIKHIAKTFHISETWLRTGEGEMEETDLFEDLVSAYDLGPAAQALMRSLARVLGELGEDACNKVIEDLLAELQAGIANRQAASVTFPQAPADEDESSASSSGSVVG